MIKKLNNRFDTHSLSHRHTQKHKIEMKTGEKKNKKKKKRRKKKKVIFNTHAQNSNENSI